MKGEDPVYQPVDNTLGVDLGINRPAVTSENQFYGKRVWKEIEAKYFRLMTSLQSKGTKSAKRRLRRLSGRLNRFRKDCDHVISRRIVDSVVKGSKIVLEDLTGILDSVKVRGVKMRRKLHSWSFSRLKLFLDYKSRIEGSLVALIDPAYTSQRCSKCGHTEKANRVGPRFKCKKCGLELNSDVNASRNIRFKYLASEGISLASGLSVNQPIVAT
jgi:IS605 OrfB family transposase